LSIIALALDLVLDAGCSLRGAAAAMATFFQHFFDSIATPCFSTIRAWLLRVGLYALTKPLDRTKPWLWLIDHTIQSGAQKILVILGCPMDQVPFGQRALQLSDLQLIALVPMDVSNGDAVERALENAALRRTGVPRLIVSDQGSDLLKGIGDYGDIRPKTCHVPDAAHYGANLLKHAWNDQPRWQQFGQQLQDTSAKLRQTKTAFLLPPRTRAKARFMNVAAQLRFAGRLLKHLDSEAPHAKALESYGWLTEFRDDLTVWHREHGLVQTAIDLVRVDGLHRGSGPLLEKAWGEIGPRESEQRIAAKLREYVVTYQSKTLGERFVASTEILESSFGKLKRIEGQQSQDGVTGLVLAIGAMLGNPTEEDLKEALEETPQKQVDGWLERTLGPTMQWLRRQFFRQNKP
jgi:hypothetical protein